MIAYREIVKNKKDIEHLFELLNSLKTVSEVIVMPLNSEDDIKDLQISSMSNTWDNIEDEAWNELSDYIK